MNAPSSTDQLYEAFSIARDSFIKTYFPKPPLRPYLHNPTWHVHDAAEDRQRLDAALAKYAVEWWQSNGRKITMNRQDGSFTVQEDTTP